jgi:gas vesicle protein
MDDESNRFERSKGSGIGAFLLGLGVGLGLSFLFSPRSGEENRQLIAEKAKEGVDYAALAIGELKDQAQAHLDNAQGAAQDLKDRVGDTVSILKDRVQEAVRAGQDAYREDLQQREAEQGGPSSRSATSGS